MMKDYMDEMLHILKLRAAQLAIGNEAEKRELALVEARIAELENAMLV